MSLFIRTGVLALLIALAVSACTTEQKQYLRENSYASWRTDCTLLWAQKHAESGERYDGECANSPLEPSIVEMFAAARELQDAKKAYAALNSYDPERNAAVAKLHANLLDQKVAAQGKPTTKDRLQKGALEAIAAKAEEDSLDHDQKLAAAKKRVEIAEWEVNKLKNRGGERPDTSSANPFMINPKN
ncbi:MAG: hypothetical protein U5J99_00520 [Parvularculaceae bacterium]|nr:hypothetical protein [Parvularculaceae bacterium]